MSDPNGLNYHFVPAGDMFARPLRCRVQATFSASGATVTVSTDGRKSHVGAAISGSAGDYDVTGLPVGSAYHVVGCELLVADGTVAVAHATVQADSLDPENGTLTFQTRTAATFAETAPADGTVVHITLDIETGIYS